ncbi:HAD hydrolase family protein, partial [Halomonas sp. SIMBA_159]
LGIPAFMITSNGARVHTCQGEVLFQQDVQPEVILGLMELTKDEPDLRIHIYRHDDWLLNIEDAYLRDFHQTFTYKLFDVNNPPRHPAAG